MTASPEKGGGPEEELRAAQTDKVAERCQNFLYPQAQWHREADRLLAEYERTLNPRHFVAWSKHVAAMRERSER
jgi:hypothetical protein